MIKFSLIIPVFNVEKYIEKCVLSCIHQSLSKTEYEIILVNDGSMDDSLFLAESLAKQYSNIEIISQDNQGVSKARNVGLNRAIGKYVWFIDPDDYIAENILCELYSILEEYELDAIWFRWNRVSETGRSLKELPYVLKKAHTNVMSGPKFMDEVLTTFLFVWAFIYKRETLVQNRLYFADMKYGEDAVFNLCLLPHLDRVKFVDIYAYFYVQRNSSAMNVVSQDKINDSKCLIEIVLQYLGYGQNVLFYRNLLSVIVINRLSLLSNDVYKNQRIAFVEYLKSKKITSISLPRGVMRKTIAIMYNITPKLCFLLIKMVRYFKH